MKQVKDCVQKLGISSSCSIDYNNYLEGTRYSANDLKGVRARYCISVCSRGCKRMTERRKLRCREPLRIFQGRLYFTSSEKVVFERSPSVSSISLGYQLKRRKGRRKLVRQSQIVQSAIDNSGTVVP